MHTSLYDILTPTQTSEYDIAKEDNLENQTPALKYFQRGVTLLCLLTALAGQVPYPRLTSGD